MSSTEPLVFIDTPDEMPPAKPQVVRKFLKHPCRLLWQDSDEPLIRQTMLDQSLKGAAVYKEMQELPKVTFNLGSPVCGRNGICSQCQLSREIEVLYRSEKDRCSQRKYYSTPHEVVIKDGKGTL